MDQYKALLYIFKLPEELSHNVSLYYHIGHLFGYSGEELMLLLIYSHFSYKWTFYAILMAKYLSTSSFSLFSVQLLQHMSTLGLDSYYYNVLRSFLSVLWPGNPLHVLRCGHEFPNVKANY